MSLRDPATQLKLPHLAGSKKKSNIFQRNKKQRLVKRPIGKISQSFLSIVLFFSFLVLLVIHSSCRAAINRIAGGDEQRGRSAAAVRRSEFEIWREKGEDQEKSEEGTQQHEGCEKLLWIKMVGIRAALGGIKDRTWQQFRLKEVEGKNKPCESQSASVGSRSKQILWEHRTKNQTTITITLPKSPIRSERAN